MLVAGGISGHAGKMARCFGVGCAARASKAVVIA